MTLTAILDLVENPKINSCHPERKRPVRRQPDKSFWQVALAKVEGSQATRYEILHVRSE